MASAERCAALSRVREAWPDTLSAGRSQAEVETHRAGSRMRAVSPVRGERPEAHRRPLRGVMPVSLYTVYTCRADFEKVTAGVEAFAEKVPQRQTPCHEHRYVRGCAAARTPLAAAAAVARRYHST